MDDSPGSPAFNNNNNNSDLLNITSDPLTTMRQRRNSDTGALNGHHGASSIDGNNSTHFKYDVSTTDTAFAISSLNKTNNNSNSSINTTATSNSNSKNNNKSDNEIALRGSERFANRPSNANRNLLLPPSMHLMSAGNFKSNTSLETKSRTKSTKGVPECLRNSLSAILRHSTSSFSMLKTPTNESNSMLHESGGGGGDQPKSHHPTTKTSLFSASAKSQLLGPTTTLSLPPQLKVTSFACDATAKNDKMHQKSQQHSLRKKSTTKRSKSAPNNPVNGKSSSASMSGESSIGEKSCFTSVIGQHRHHPTLVGSRSHNHPRSSGRYKNVESKSNSNNYNNNNNNTDNASSSGSSNYHNSSISSTKW